MNGCSRCGATTNGDCGMHVAHPCINCGKDKPGMTQMPYPSEHDGDWLCNECLAEIVDTALGVRSGRYLVIS